MVDTTETRRIAVFARLVRFAPAAGLVFALGAQDGACTIVVNPEDADAAQQDVASEPVPEEARRGFIPSDDTDAGTPDEQAPIDDAGSKEDPVVDPVEPDPTEPDVPPQPALRTINGDVYVQTQDELDALRDVEVIRGSLTIQGISLTSFSSLAQLRECGSLHISYFRSHKVDFDGSGEVQPRVFHGDVVLEDAGPNHPDVQLTDISGLKGATIEGRLSLWTVGVTDFGNGPIVASVDTLFFRSQSLQRTGGGTTLLGVSECQAREIGDALGLAYTPYQMAEDRRPYGGPMPSKTYTYDVAIPCN